MLRYFASNSTRRSLSRTTCSKLEEIRERGVEALKPLEPYKRASVFLLAFSERLVGDAEYTNVKDMASDSASGVRRALNEAADMMGEIFVAYPSSENAYLETTSALQAMFFVGVLCRYCPDAIFEDMGAAKDKQRMADEFIRFYDGRVSKLMEPGSRWKDAKELHEACFEAYQEFTQSLPGLFDKLRLRLGLTTQAQLMASYGSGEFTLIWTNRHYRGDL